MNFLEETLKEIEKHNLEIKDILYIGSQDISLTWEQFKELADVDYYNGFGGQEMPRDIEIYFKNFKLVRDEYDGSERWSLVDLKLPKGKPYKGNIRTFMDEFSDASLEEHLDEDTYLGEVDDAIEQWERWIIEAEWLSDDECNTKINRYKKIKEEYMERLEKEN